MTYPNKKYAYIKNASYDVAMRSNCKGITNIPTISKVEVNISDPTVALSKQNILPILTALELITKQKPKIIRSKGVIQKYNIRKGALIGGKVTVKGNAAISFLENLVTIVLPKAQNPKNFKKGNISKDGSLNLTLHNPLIFNELEQEFEKFAKIPSIRLTVNTTTGGKKEALSLLSYINIPFI